MKSIIYISVILFVLLSLYVFYSIASDNIEIKPKLNGLNLSLGVSGASDVKTNIGLSILNKNNFSILIKNIYFEVFYKGELIIKSVDFIPEIKINKKSETLNNISIIIRPNKEFFEFTKMALAEKETEIVYNASFKLLGFTIKQNNKQYKIKYDE